MKKRPIKEQWFDSESEEINGKLRAKKPEIAINDGSEDWAMKGLNHGELKINELPDDPTIFMLDRNGQIVQFKPGGDIDFLTKYFIRKDIEDVDHKHLILEEGVRVDNLAALQRSTIKEFLSSEKFVSGLTGEGFRIWNDILTGKWNGEFDNITVREIFFAFELLIQKYRSINGGLVISQGNGKIKSVTETETHYLLEMEGDMTFMPGDFIRCQAWGAGTVEEYKFDFNSDIWLYDHTQDMTLDNTSHTLHFTRAGEEMHFLVTYGCEMGETINITLKITGVNTESTLITADDEHMDGITIDKDGIYTFVCTRTKQMGVWGIAYLGTVGEKDILIEQVPEQKVETVTTKYYWVKVDSIEGNTVKVLKSEFYDETQPSVYPFDFTDSDKWMFDRHQDMDIERTNHSINLTRAGAEVLLVVTHDSLINETEHITLKITGVNTESTLITADDEHMDGITIDKDGIYNFYYTQTPELGVWGIFYKGTIGEKNILIEQLPNPVDIPEKNLPSVGDEVVQMGNETDVTRQALILLSAAGDGKPVIDVLAGVNSKSFSGKLMTRVGDLSGIVDPDFPSDRQPSGFGIYCPNFYGKGMFVLSSGETIEDYTNRTIIEAVPGEVKTEISKIQIGGVNLIINSKESRTITGKNGFYLELTTPTKIGKKYTLSITRLNTVGQSPVNAYFSNSLGSAPRQYIGNNWKVDTLTSSVEADAEWKGISFYQEVNGETGEQIFIAEHFQLEEGTVATAWRESTTDILSQSKSLIKQTADEINLSVTTKTKAGKIYIRGTGYDNPHSRALIINDDGVNQFINSRGLALAVIQRSNLLILEISYYDIYGSVEEQNSFVAKLNSLDDSVFVVLSSYDAISYTGEIQAAIQRCGGTYPILNSRSPYALLGIPGIGLGRGIESFSMVTTVPPVEITAMIINEMFTGSDNAAFQYTKTEVSVASDKIRLQLNNTGIDIENRQITLNAESTTIKSGDTNIAMFKVEDGKPVIRGELLKISEGAEIAGFTITPDSLHSYDGKSSISIGALSAGYRGITLSTKNETLLNVFAGTATGTGITSNAPTALVTYGSVEMHQRKGQNWNVAGVLFGGTIYGTSYQTWGNGAGDAGVSVQQSYSRYYVYHKLNHTDYHVIATPYYDSSGGNYDMHLNSYIRIENKTPTGFYLQVVNADNGKAVNSGIMFTIIGRNTL